MGEKSGIDKTLELKGKEELDHQQGLRKAGGKGKPLGHQDTTAARGGASNLATGGQGPRAPSPRRGRVRAAARLAGPRAVKL